MFDVNQKVVYPGHGVAEVTALIEKIIGGVATVCYELKFLTKDVTILVPVVNAEMVGIRALSSCEYISDVFTFLATPARKLSFYEFTASTWNKRNKEYKIKLGKGGLRELCEVYRDLRLIETQKELSFGEKNLLAQTETLLVEEISLVQRKNPEEVIEALKIICRKSFTPQEPRVTP